MRNKFAKKYFYSTFFVFISLFELCHTYIYCDPFSQAKIIKCVCNFLDYVDIHSISVVHSNQPLLCKRYFDFQLCTKRVHILCKTAVVGHLEELYDALCNSSFQDACRVELLVDMDHCSQKPLCDNNFCYINHGSKSNLMLGSCPNGQLEIQTKGQLQKQLVQIKNIATFTCNNGTLTASGLDQDIPGDIESIACYSMDFGIIETTTEAEKVEKESHVVTNVLFTNTGTSSTTAESSTPKKESSTAETATEPSTTSQKPSSSDEPSTTKEELSTTESPSNTKEPSITDEPSRTTKKEPSTTEKPNTMEWPTTIKEQPSTTKEEPSTTKKPSTMEELSITKEKPSTTEKTTITTEEPSTTGQPSTTDQLSATEEPSTTDQLSATEEPSTTDQLSTTEKPNTMEWPATIKEQPSATDEPSTTKEEPSTMEELSITKEKPSTTEKTTITTEEPSTTDVDCAYTWNAWSTCSQSCDTGTRNRTATVFRSASGAGFSCPKDETEPCNTEPCEATAEQEQKQWNTSAPVCLSDPEGKFSSTWRKVSWHAASESCAAAGYNLLAFRSEAQLLETAATNLPGTSLWTDLKFNGTSGRWYWLNDQYPPPDRGAAWPHGLPWALNQPACSFDDTTCTPLAGGFSDLPFFAETAVCCSSLCVTVIQEQPRSPLLFKVAECRRPNSHYNNNNGILACSIGPCSTEVPCIATIGQPSRTHTQSIDHCRKNGYSLASFRSLDEYEQFMNLRISELNGNDVWIGLKTIDGSNWFWTDNTALTFNPNTDLNWAVGHPQQCTNDANPSVECCAKLVKRQGGRVVELQAAMCNAGGSSKAKPGCAVPCNSLENLFSPDASNTSETLKTCTYHINSRSSVRSNQGVKNCVGGSDAVSLCKLSEGEIETLQTNENGLSACQGELCVCSDYSISHSITQLICTSITQPKSRGLPLNYSLQCENGQVFGSFGDKNVHIYGIESISCPAVTGIPCSMA